MAAQDAWHGMPLHEFVTKKTVAPARSLSPTAAAASSTISYAHVHFTGNYGANLCGEYQEHDEYNITKDSAHQIAWSLYGACGHKIYYYDTGGKLIDQE
jgi:hypothetical protein